jgi:hypothetical protein
MYMYVEPQKLFLEDKEETIDPTPTKKASYKKIISAIGVNEHPTRPIF